MVADNRTSLDSLGDAVVPTMMELHRSLRAAAIGMFTVGAAGCIAAVGILRNRSWGWSLLASVLSATSVVLFVARVRTTPRYVSDPNWSLVFSVTALAAFCWWQILKPRANTEKA
jgi:hypothetical protein